MVERTIVALEAVIERGAVHPINTTTSMGRLTLNVLLSFAQFEREVTGERIRDKIAASKRKGTWMGGKPPLGYDLRDRCLVVNKAEAETVRLIFRLYLDLKTLRRVREELNRRSVISKQWTSRGNVRHGGCFPNSPNAWRVED